MQDPEILTFCYKSIRQKLGRMLKTLVPKFRSDLSVRLRGIADKQVPVRLTPIEGSHVTVGSHWSSVNNQRLMVWAPKE